MALEKAEIVRAVRAGRADNEIADEFHITTRTLNTVKAEYEAIREAYSAGKTVEEMSSILTLPTVYVGEIYSILGAAGGEPGREPERETSAVSEKATAAERPDKKLPQKRAARTREPTAAPAAVSVPESQPSENTAVLDRLFAAINRLNKEGSGEGRETQTQIFVFIF